MMRVTSCLFGILASTTLLAQSGATRHHDVAITDITAPQPQYQVMTSEQAQAIYTEQQALTDLKEKFTSIQQDLNDVKADVKVLMAQHAVLSFVLTCLSLLVPGILIAAFSIWFSELLKGRKPPTPPAIHPQAPVVQN
jgi:hypothetical protein